MQEPRRIVDLLKGITLVREYTDLSRVFFFPYIGLPFNLRAFSGSKIEIGGSLRPEVNSYAALRSTQVEVAYIDRKQALTTSGASEMHSVDFIPVQFTPSDIDDDLTIEGSGVYFVYIKSLGNKRNLLDYRQVRYSPNFAKTDDYQYNTNSLEPVEAFRIDLGSVKTIYFHNYITFRSYSSSYTAYYKIEYSADGSTWTETASGSTTSTTEQPILIRRYLTTRYIRWLIWTNNTNNLSTIRIKKVWIIGE
ncbi:MAG: discoidin domain-containing protein [Nitrososphaeria archaeon]